MNTVNTIKIAILLVMGCISGAMGSVYVVTRFALDDGSSGTYVSQSREIIEWVSDDFLGFGYFKNKSVSFIVTFDMTNLDNNPIEAYIELYQVHQVGSNPWKNNPWCDRADCMRGYLYASDA